MLCLKNELRLLALKHSLVIFTGVSCKYLLPKQFCIPRLYIYLWLSKVMTSIIIIVCWTLLVRIAFKLSKAVLKITPILYDEMGVCNWFLLGRYFVQHMVMYWNQDWNTSDWQGLTHGSVLKTFSLFPRDRCASYTEHSAHVFLCLSYCHNQLSYLLRIDKVNFCVYLVLCDVNWASKNLWKYDLPIV